MIQLDPVKLIVNVSESYLPLIKLGMKVRVATDVYPDEAFQGTVFRIHPTINAASRTFAVEVRVPNRLEKLVPGMFARVNLIMGEKMALMVHSIAVLQVSGTNERYVMLNDNGTAKRVMVKILKRHDDQLEIDSPEIHEGEQLIYAGQSQLEDGTKITVVAD
jgi:RND family efflux transporter MFP subunit